VPDAVVTLRGLDTTKVQIVESGGVSGRTGAPGSADYGAHTWNLYSASAGTFTATLQVETAPGQWEDVSPVPVTLRFNAGAASAADSWLIQPETGAQADGVAEVEVKARVRDTSGNNAVSGQVDFTVPAGVTGWVGGKATVGGAGVTLAAPVSAGYATVVYTSRRAGTHLVSAKVAGGDISTVKDALEATTLATSGLVKLNFTAGQAAADESELTVPTAAGGAAKVADGIERHRAEVQARDAFGNPAPGAIVMFRHGPDDAHLTEATVTADASGLASVEFASSTVAVYQVRAYVGGDQVDGSPAEAPFVAGPFDLAKTLASFEVQTSTALATGTHPLGARLKAQDATGNPIAGAALGFKLTGGGDGPVFEPVASGAKEFSGRSGADGFLTAMIVSEFDGAFPVVGVVGASETAPQLVRFASDAAAPAKSWFTFARNPGNTSDPAAANGSDSYRVTVNLRGSQGGPLNGVQAVAKMTDPVTGATEEHTVTSGRVGAASGVAHFDLTSTKAGSFDVTVELGGDQLALGSAAAGAKVARAVFNAGPPAAAASRLIGPETGPAQADGLEQQVIRAAVTDAHANPTPGAAVIFAIPEHVTALGPAPPGAPAAAGPTIAGPAEVTVTADATGQARLVLVSRVRGAYPITASLAGTAITDGSPAEAVFANAGLAAGRSVFSIPTASSAKVVRIEFHRPTVELFDSSGNPYTDASVPVTFRWRRQGASAWAGSQTVNSQAGVAVWTDWTVAKAGTYEVEAAIASGVIGSPLTARFVAGPALPAASTFSSSAGALVLNDGKAAHFAEVAVTDAVVGGNAVAGAPVTFTVDGSASFVGGSGQTLTVDSSALGLARVQIVDAKPGGETVKVTAAVDGVEVGSAELEFGTGAGDADRSSWSVRPATALSAAHPAVLADGLDSWQGVVTLRDAAGRPVSGSDVVFDLPTAVAITQGGPYRTDASGQVTVTFTSRRAGAYAVRAVVGAQPVAPGPATVTFAAGPIAADVSSLEAPGVTAVADGQSQLTVRAHILDAEGNPVPGATVRFTLPPELTAAGQPTPGGTVDVPVDPATGLAELAVSTRTAGAYAVTAASRLGDAAAWTPVEKGGPAEVRFTAGPVAATRSQITRSPSGPLQVGAPGAVYEVRVLLRDKLGNAVEKENVPIQFRFFLGGDPSDPERYCGQAPDANTQFASALTDSAGVATVPFASNLAGEWHGCGYYAGDEIIRGSPVDLTFDPGAPDLARSDLTVSQNLVLADGAASHYGEVTLRDASGNPLGGKAVTIAIGQGSPSVPGPNVKGEATASATVTTCDPAHKGGAPSWCVMGGVFRAGLAHVEFTSEEPGTFDISASVGGQAAGGSPQAVSFTAGPAAATRSSWEIDPNTADPVHGGAVTLPASGRPGDAYRLTVTARSAAGLLAPGVRVRLAGLDPAVTVAGGVEGVTGAPGGAYGQHVWRLSSAVAGEFTGRVQVFEGGSWVDVGGPFTVRFGAGGAGDAPTSSFTLVKSDPREVVVPADGAASYDLTVDVMNGSAQGVAGACVTPQLPAGVVVRSGATGHCPRGSYQTDGSGRVALRIASTVAGWAGIGVRLGGVAIPTRPGGADHARLALFVGGPPSAARSELTSPAAPAQAGDPAGQKVTVTLRDAHGNLASCWDGARQTGCRVALAVPAGTSAGVPGVGQTPGPAVITATTQPVDLGPMPTAPVAGSLVRPRAGGAVEARYLGAEGRYEVTGRVGGRDLLVADGVVSASGPAKARIVFTAPAGPGPEPTGPTPSGGPTGGGSGGPTGGGSGGQPGGGSGGQPGGGPGGGSGGLPGGEPGGGPGGESGGLPGGAPAVGPHPSGVSPWPGADLPRTGAAGRLGVGALGLGAALAGAAALFARRRRRRRSGPRHA
jgi:LPXTG-motif cell wall-anchored protein